MYGWAWDYFSGGLVKGIEVKIWQRDNFNSVPDAVAVTDADGYYTFPTLAPGEYVLWFGGADFISQWWDVKGADRSGATVLTVSAGGAPVRADAVLDHWGNVAGTLTNSKGKPVANRWVTLHWWDESSDSWEEFGSLPTDSRGRFSQPTMTPGFWAVGALDRPKGSRLKVEGHYLSLLSFNGTKNGGLLDPWVDGMPTNGLAQKADVGPGSWKKTSFSYQWLRNGKSVPKATKKTYTPSTADVGSHLQVRVTSRQGDNSFTVTSPGSWRILRSSVPTIQGALAVGGEVSVDPGLWQLDTDFRFQWYADGKAISGATDTSFVLAKAQLGKRLTVKAIGKYHAFPEISRISTATAKVATAGTPTVTGTAVVGSTLKAKPGTWTKKTKLSYQWLRNGKAIRKATKSSYKLVAADRGAQISVRVTGKLSGYATVSKTSAPLTILT